MHVVDFSPPQSALLSAPIGLTEHKASTIFRLTPLWAPPGLPCTSFERGASAHFAFQPVVKPFMLSPILWRDDREKSGADENLCLVRAPGISGVQWGSFRLRIQEPNFGEVDSRREE